MEETALKERQRHAGYMATARKIGDAALAGWTSAAIGAVAFMIAKAAGVPVWIDGFVLPGDATDIGVTVALASWGFFAMLRNWLRPA